MKELVFPLVCLSFFNRCLLLKMTAIEKLQMLIEAAEYLDRRERGKDVLRHMKIIFCMQINPDTVARVFVCYLLGECMICTVCFFSSVMKFGEDDQDMEK